MQRPRIALVTGTLVLLAHSATPQKATVVDIPDPALFFQNTTFATAGNAGFVVSFDEDRLWSFSLSTGVLLDADGLALPAPATASDVTIFPGELAVVPGWFPSQGVFVADVSTPSALAQIGVIGFPPTTNIQGQNVEVDPNGVVGYVAGFPNDTLYSFNVQTLALEDPDGLALPGNPDRIALGDGRLAIVDTTQGRILVADVSDPANLSLAGTIALPGSSSFGSNDNIAVADDGRTAFVSSQERVLYSFDLLTLSVLDPDGLSFGTQLFGDHVELHGDTLACLWSRGLAFVDASDPTDLTLVSNASFGQTVAPQGSATVAFSADGTRAAVPVVFPGNLVYTFDVATGAALGAPLAVDDQPNFLTSFGTGSRVGVLCSGNGADNVWLIDGLLEDPGVSTYCTAKSNSCGTLPAIGWAGAPSAAATAGFHVFASTARAAKQGLALYGPNGPGATPFQGGLLCVHPQGLRRSVSVVASDGAAGMDCTSYFELDWAAFASGNAGGNPQAFLLQVGQQVNLQWWGRDSVANGSFLSDGLQYLVLP